MTLTEFLLARIAEDEERFAIDPDALTAQEWADRGDLNEAWIAAMNRRMLAECEAKREIVGLYEDAGYVSAPDMGWHFMKATVRALAHVYASHPDYQQEWKP